MDKNLRILLIEDNESDALLNIRHLQKAGFIIQFERIETAAALKDALEDHSWDLILADYQLPQFDAPTAFKIFRETDLDIPFIVISGVIGEEKAVEMMKAGVHDYFLKNNLTRLASAVTRELREAQIREEQKKTHHNILIQHQLSFALSKIRSLYDALDLLMEAVCSLDGVDGGGVYLFNKENGDLELHSHRGLSQPFIERVLRYAKNTPGHELVLAGKPLYDLTTEFQVNRLEKEREGLCLISAIPIQSEGKIIGSLNLASRSTVSLSRITIMALESIATQIGGTISRLQAEQSLMESQRDLQQLFDSVADFILIFDLDGRILNANPYARQKLGYTEEELLFMSASDIHAEENREEMIKIVREIRSGNLNTIPYPLRTKAGILIPVDTRVTPGKWGNKDVLIGISRDITERKRTEDALKTSEERFRRIFEDVSIGMVTSDQNYHFIRCNTAFCKFIGYSEKELQGLTFADITHPDHLERDVKAIDRLVRREISIYRTEKKYITKDRRVVWGSLVASVLYGAAGEMIHMLAMVEDINDRKNAEQEILKWKHHYEVVAMTSGQAVYDYDLNSGSIHWGGKTLQVLGYTGDQIGHLDKWEALIHPDDRKRTIEVLNKACLCGDSFDATYRFLHKDGRYLHLHDRGVVICDPDRKPVTMVGMMQDITSLVLAEKELIEKEERYRKLFDLSPSSIILEDTDGNILDVNNAYCRTTGYSREELIGKNVMILVPDSPKRERIIKKDISVVLSGRLHEHEVLNLRKDGTPINFELHETLIPLPDGRQGILVVANDVSERKRSQELMLESRRQLEIFAEHLQEVREEERISLARELHDNLGQNLTALKIDISRILKKLQDAPSHRHSEQINTQGQNMLQLIDLTIDLVRKISSDLRPAVLDELGIISAIEWQIHEFTKLSGIPCEIDIDVKKVIIPPEFSVGVFRIFQEMLTNIIRHARASKVIIRLKKKYSSIILEVEDNGSGINEDKVNDHKSLGLIGMRERAVLFGGNVTITGKKGKGTRVILTIPTKKQLYD